MIRPVKHPIALGLGALLLIIAIGLVLIFQYLKIEQERDLQQWQVRLGLIADTRVEAIDRWLGRQFTQLEELANNASLQLYLSQLTRTETEADAGIEPAQLGYLRNLILAAAERGDFEAGLPGDSHIPANLPRRGYAGLGLLDARGKLLVATAHMPALGDAARAAVARSLDSGRRTLQTITLSADRHALVAFAVPVFAVQGTSAARTEQPIGVVYGVKNAEKDLFPLLDSQRLLGKHSETLLIGREDSLVVYLSPLQDGTVPTQRRLTLQIQALAATRAVRAPGTFARLPDYRGEEVLMTSRELQNAPWILVQKVDAATALSESREHRRFLLTAFLLTLFFVSASLVAAWRHGTSLKAQHMATALREKSRELEGQSRLLHAVTDNVTDFLFLLDSEHAFLFANRPLANTVAIPVEDIPGKTLASVLGTDVATLLNEFLAGRTDNPASRLLDLQIAGMQRRFECRVLAIPGQPGLEQATLVVLHDVTALHRAQQKQAETLHQTIKALMRAVDTYDPYSANHSARTAAVANAVAREMQLPEEERRALDMAANLANVGKIFLPKDILTRTTALTEEEHEQLKLHVQYSLDILSNLEFDGPVLEIVGQKQEYMNGSGYPKGLSGDQIRLSARILAAANAFVAMASPRAYREGVGVDEALDSLLAEAGKKYDRHVIAALFHIMENKLEWEKAQIAPEK